MKRILITGKDSYIGTSFEKWVAKDSSKYSVDTLDVRNESWDKKSFLGYDVVFHVAGIAHIKETAGNRPLYYRVNRDLAYRVAEKAKNEGVNQFVFLSSMSVYGLEKGVINESTLTKPKSSYGKSKIEAEVLIERLRDDSFTVAILRPPMVYGKNCRGNYPKLVNLAIKIPVFPRMDNRRSMIYIDNLSEFVKLLVDNKSGGLFFPQNAKYVNTSDLVKKIAELHGKDLLLTKFFNPLLNKINISVFNKVFGSLVYDMKMSEYRDDYIVCDFTTSIVKTEDVRND